jgi:hypothetical protein
MGIVVIILIIVGFNIIDEYLKKEKLKKIKEEEIKKQREVVRYNNFIKEQKEKEKRRSKEIEDWRKEIEQKKIKQQTKIIFLKSKKNEVYYYNKEMLMKFINENRNDWHYSLNFLNSINKTKNGRHYINIYEIKDFYVEYEYSEYTDTGSTSIIDKSNNIKTNVLLHGHWSDFY